MISAEVENKLNRILEAWKNLDIEEKRRRLIFDEKFGNIIELSEEIYNKAIEVLNGKKIEYDTNEKSKLLEEYLKQVKPHNIMSAKRIISEAMLDLEYIKDPTVQILSLRLGNIKIMKGERE